MTYHSSYLCPTCGHRFEFHGHRSVLTLVALDIWDKQVANHALAHLVEVANALRIVEALNG